MALTRCAECGEASIDAGGQSHPVDEAIAAMAACDSQHLGAVGGREAPENDNEPSSAQAPSPHVGAAAAGTPRRRASQATPPAVRRRVMRRDRGRCAVPGCEGHLFLDVHRVDPRSEGGSHDPERLVCLCGAHHRATHAGRLCIDGTATQGFTFRHADGTPYGEPLRPAAIELVQQAFGALRHLGFGPTRAQTLVDAVARAGAPDDLEAFVRAALEAS